MVEATQEQQEAMKEKLANMSPEELKEFQKKQCIFCQIISGKVASKNVYSDEKCTAIMDINPANPGHILLLPNEHYGIMPLIPEEELGHLFMVAKALAHASLKALEAQGANIFVANGVTAGQKAQHFMIHVIPRKEGDNVKLDIPENDISASDAKQLMDRLKPAIEKALGPGLIEEKEEEPKAEEEKPEKEQPTETKKEEKTKAPVKKKSVPKGKFVTSEKARRFHSSECPFAEKIPEDDRIYVDENEASEMKNLACGCTGLRGKKKPKKEEPKEEPEEDVDDDNDEATEEIREEIEENMEDETEEQPEEDSELDDISRMLTGG